jgi:pimeloyl-ACP methyl ester carboxylesterase
VKRRLPPRNPRRGGRPLRDAGASSRRRRRLLGLLGVAAVGVGVAWMARRERDRAALPPGDIPAPGPEPQPAAEPPGRFVEGAAGRLWVRTAGDKGPALLLLHALGGSSGHWEPQLAALGPHGRLAAVDLRGHGRSAAGPGAGFTIEDHAADALAVADALGFDHFAVAGHSLGAAVAVELAAAHPRRVTAVALVDPGADASEEPTAEVDAGIASVAADPRAEFTYHYREFLHGARRDTARRVLADLAATPDAVLLGSYAAMMRYPLRRRLAAWSGPRLCLAGPLNDVAGSLPSLVKDLPTEWLAPTSHWLQLDRPEETGHLLGDLLARAARGARSGR